MISSKTLKIAGAAILGTLVGTSSAYAQITLGTGASPTVSNKLHVARESLLSTGKVTAGGTDYYALGDLDRLEVRIPVGYTIAATDTLRIQYDLTGMVFRGGITPDSLEAKTDGSTSPQSTTGDVASVTEAFGSGGASGSTTVAFTMTGAALTPTNYISLRPGSGLAISADGKGSVAVTIERRTAAGFSFPIMVPPLTDVVEIVDGIDDGVTDTSNAVADVSEGFMRFSDDTGIGDADLKAQFGKIQIAVYDPPDDATFRTSQTGGVPSAADRSGLATSVLVGFTGDTSFAKKADDVYLSATDQCAEAGNTALLEEDGDGYSWLTGDDRVTDQQARDKFFCIKVDGETVIPETEYIAAIDYTAITNAAFPPQTPQQFPLGEITRDGTIVNIPFFSTSDGYNHRLVLTNRGSSPAPYEVTFTTEDGVTATGGSSATGMLQPGVTTIPAADLVTIEGGARTAVTVEATAAPADLGVATVLVNRGDGSTDTVVYN